jgi:hypothetical protein
MPSGDHWERPGGAAVAASLVKRLEGAADEDGTALSNVCVGSTATDSGAIE